jgi:hypothetical protein
VDTDAAANFDTVAMRAQAQTQQVEIFGNDGLTFAVGLQAGATVTLDTDSDTLPDWWETQFNLSPTNATGANGALADNDGDGLTNAEEFAFGTNPGVADSAFVQVRVTKPAPAQAALHFQTRAGRTYRIYYTNDLTQPFTALPGLVPGTGSEVTWTDDGSQTGTAPNAEIKRFYKVAVVIPPSE